MQNVYIKNLLKALKFGTEFTGEYISYLFDSCSEAAVMRAYYESADKFTTEDIDALYGIVDDEILMETAEKYNFSPNKTNACTKYHLLQ